MAIARGLPGGDFSAEGRDVWQAAVQTLLGEHGNFTLGHIEPTAMLGCIVRLLSLQRHFDVLTQFAHVESRLSSRKRQRELVFYTSVNHCDKRACSASVAVGLLDSRVVDEPMAYNLTFVILSSLKPLFFNSIKNELRFSGLSQISVFCEELCLTIC